MNQEVLTHETNRTVPLNDDGVVVVYSPEFTLANLEKVYLEQSLVHFSGNKTKAAKALGITVKTLYNKLHEYELFEKFKAVTTPKLAEK